MGGLCVASAFATLFLPESFGRPLPETIEQMSQRGRWVSKKYTFFLSLSPLSNSLLYIKRHQIQNNYGRKNKLPSWTEFNCFPPGISLN